MNSKFASLLFSWFLIALSSMQISGQGYVDILPEDVKVPFRDKYSQITANIQGLHSNEWAGSYTRYVGETWSEVLVWAPNDGFAAFRDTCSNGPRAWVNFGSAKFQNGTLILNSEQVYKGEHTLFMKQELTPVKWGHQRWLIPTDDLELFAYAVNSDSWEDYGRFYVKTDGNENDPKGLPGIPSQFKHILSRKTIKAKLLEAGEKPESWYGDITIDAGKNKGVIVGMSFWPTGVRNTNVKISVFKVNEKNAVAKVISVGYSYDIDDSGNQKGLDPGEFDPKPGFTFTSRNPYKGK